MLFVQPGSLRLSVGASYRHNSARLYAYLRAKLYYSKDMGNIIRNEGETLLGDGDYVLVDGAAWFTIKGLSVRIITDENVMNVAVCHLGHEDEDPILGISGIDAAR